MTWFDIKARAKTGAPFAEEISFAAIRDGACSISGESALVIENDLDVRGIAPDILGKFRTILLQFPAFTDGRAYTQAALLRQRCGFRGLIGAVGDVLPDQAYLMARAGISILKIDGKKQSDFVNALTRFSHFYQCGADGSLPAWRRRSGARRAV